MFEAPGTEVLHAGISGAVGRIVRFTLPMKGLGSTMKILVIHGSPHKGFTLKLTKRFEETMKKCGDVSFEYLSLNELNITMCRGCFNCVTKGEEFCSLKNDDVTLILSKMDEADGTIFSAPTYVFNTPALMKNLIDRLAFLGHRPRYFTKYAVAISTTCGAGLKESLKYLSFGTAGAWGFHLSGILGANTHPFFLDNKSRKNLNNKITALAGKFYRDLTKMKLPTVSFEEVMRFRVMSLHSLYSKEIFPADYKFYHENKNLGKDYYLNSAKISTLTRMASKLLAFQIDKSMRKSRDKSDIHQVFLS